MQGMSEVFIDQTPTSGFNTFNFDAMAIHEMENGHCRYVVYCHMTTSLHASYDRLLFEMDRKLKHIDTKDKKVIY